jgi:hypothetical protein
MSETRRLTREPSACRQVATLKIVRGLVDMPRQHGSKMSKSNHARSRHFAWWLPGRQRVDRLERDKETRKKTSLFLLVYHLINCSLIICLFFKFSKSFIIEFFRPETVCYNHRVCEKGFPIISRVLLFSTLLLTH